LIYRKKKIHLLVSSEKSVLATKSQKHHPLAFRFVPLINKNLLKIVVCG
jgi:hypothetical protein